MTLHGGRLLRVAHLTSMERGRQRHRRQQAQRFRDQERLRSVAQERKIGQRAATILVVLMVLRISISLAPWLFVVRRFLPWAVLLPTGLHSVVVAEQHRI